MLVQTGGGEIFLDQNVAFVERARAAGVAVTHEVSDGMVHVFQAFGFQPSAAALRSIANFVSGIRH
jgi:acetyl esterase/lipase